MALIHIVRDIPEYKGGAVEADIPEQDFPILNKRGWRKADSKPSKEFEKEIQRQMKLLHLKKSLKRTLSRGALNDSCKN